MRLPLLVTSTLNVVDAIGILIVGYWLAGRAQVLVARSLDRMPHLDSMLKGFFGNVARYFVLTLTVLAVLS
jgi:small conductance mechanosensitive channel